MILDYLFLAVVFLIGGLVVWEDIRLKKISNNLIVIGLAFGLILISTGLISKSISVAYAEKIILNVFLSMGAAMLIWKAGFWPAGDSKFFILLSFILPLTYYRNTYLEFFPSFALLFNIFVVFLLFIFLRSLWTLTKKMKEIYKYSKSTKKFAKLFLEKIRENFSKLFKNKALIIGSMLKIILQFIFVSAIYFLLIEFLFKREFSLSMVIIFFAIFNISQILINFDMRENSYEKIKVANLKAGDNLDNISFSKLVGSRDVMDKIGKLYPEGLNLFQVNILKEYFQKNGPSEVTIHRVMPFSIWMMLGVVATIIFKGIIKINFF